MTHSEAALKGHDQAARDVTLAFQSGRMHHAWLITGIEGIGKATLALHIAHHVLSKGENPIGKLDGKHPSSKLINAEAHPDTLLLRRTANDKGELRDVIVVEDALKIAAFLHKTSTHNGWRVVIIDEAHALNRHGQNAILKILEEPPARALIVMTATSPGALLPTIRSRCRKLALEPLDAETMKSILLMKAPDLLSEEIDALLKLSGGSIGFALKVIATQTLPLYQDMLSLLGELPTLDMTRLHKLADQIGRKADAESFEVLSTLLTELLRRSVHARALGQEDTIFPALSFEKALHLHERNVATFALAASANLDRKLAFVNAVSDIRRALA